MYIGHTEELQLKNKVVKPLSLPGRSWDSQRTGTLMCSEGLVSLITDKHQLASKHSLVGKCSLLYIVEIPIPGA